MREASTSELTGIISENLIQPNCRTYTILEVYINGVATYIDDLDVSKGIDWSESGKKEKYANFSLTPLAGTCKFQVDNINGRYSPGSGTSFEGIFDNDTKIRLTSGYYLQDYKSETDTSLNLNDISGAFVKSFFYRASYDTGVIKIDGSDTSILTHFIDEYVPMYDSTTYDSTTYTPGSYTVQTYDMQKQGFEKVTGFSVTANNTDGVVYYRGIGSSDALSNSNISQWISAGSSVNGTKSIVLSNPEDKRYFQVAIIYDGISYSGGQEVSDITVTTQSRLEPIYSSVYYLDTPLFDDPPAPKAPKIYCSGRDAYKKAINADINIEDYSGSPITPTNFIKAVCDKVGIQYNATSIANISGFTNIDWDSGFGEIKKADDAFKMIMEKIIPSDYQMWLQYDETIDDNIMYVQQKPDTSLSADGAFSFTNYVSIGSSRKNNDKALQRLTFISDQQILSAEEQLDQESISSTGDTVFSWTGNAEYKRFEADYPNNIRGTVVVTPTGATLTVTEITGTVVVTLYGNKFDSTEPTYQGEAINFNNQMDNIGSTSSSVNPLLSSYAECKTSAEAFIDDFASPIQEASGLRYPYLNLLPEINDLFLMWRRYFLDDNLYLITKISHHWDESSNPRQETIFNLDDSGNNFSDNSDFVYDDYPYPMNYDSGFLYDMGISTPQSTDAEIDAASIIINNVSFS